MYIGKTLDHLDMVHEPENIYFQGVTPYCSQYFCLLAEATWLCFKMTTACCRDTQVAVYNTQSAKAPRYS